MPASVEYRPDAERLRAVNNEVRSQERLHAHYLIERQLAARLRAAHEAERSSLYTELYTELFARVPDHPQHKVDSAKRRSNIARQVEFLRAYLTPNSVFVEIGCGDAAVTQALAASAQETIGIDVTPALVDLGAAPTNFRFVQTDGTRLAVDSDRVDVVYSNQLIEHLHPDDASRHLQEVCRILKSGGLYICTTPNRITGPHDISGYFGYEPDGFHMREYDHAALASAFQDAGFRSARAQVSVKGRRLTLPIAPIALAESAISSLPRPARARLARVQQLKNLAGLTLIGRK